MSCKYTSTTVLLSLILFLIVVGCRSESYWNAYNDAIADGKGETYAKAFAEAIADGKGKTYTYGNYLCDLIA